MYNKFIRENIHERKWQRCWLRIRELPDSNADLTLNEGIREGRREEWYEYIRVQRGPKECLAGPLGSHQASSPENGPGLLSLPRLVTAGRNPWEERPGCKQGDEF